MNVYNYYVAGKGNRWFRLFTVFCRMALAAGFIPSGAVKIMGERFTDLSNNHPLGHYLEALWHTGYYYTFIGIAQVLAAIMLLIPRMATLGALLYLPIIVNITILSFAVRFDGSMPTAPLMVMANLYLICWDYDKLKLIIPFSRAISTTLIAEPAVSNWKFPWGFAAGSLGVVITYFVVILNVYSIRPRNTLQQCQKQCGRKENPKACLIFCDCIYVKGMPLDKSLDAYDQAKSSH